MKVQITARRLSLTPAIASYLNKKMDRLERHFDHLVWASAVLAVEKHRHIAEIVIHSPLHTMRAKAESKDLYSAIDLVVDKADKQLKKIKEKRKEITRSRAHSERTFLAGRMQDAVSLSSSALEEMNHHRGMSEASLPSLVTIVKQVPVKPVSVDEAIQSMESVGYNFWMFLNRATKKLNVLFRRSDQTYGLLEPSHK